MDIFSSIQDLNRDWFNKNNIRSFTSEGYEDSFFDISRYNKGFNADVDYSPKDNLRMPAFGGIYYIATEAIRFSPDTVLSFTASSPKSAIKKLCVEIKPKGREWMHETFEFDITDHPTSYKISFSDFRKKETLNCVEEITFVIKPNFFTNKSLPRGSIIVENIGISSKVFSRAEAQESISKKIQEIEDQVNSIYNFVTGNLKEDIITIKQDFNARLDVLHNEEQEISKMIAACSDMINRGIHNSIDNSMIEKHNKRLSELFDKLWEKFNNETRTSLVSAAVLWDGCRSISAQTEFDYSGICICATSALEREIRRVFFMGFMKHIEKLPNQSVKFIVKDNKEFTLGTLKPMLNFSRKMPFTLSNPNGSELSNKDYKDKLYGYSGKIRCINKPYRIIEEMNKENGFVEKIENIRENYRNKAAHTNNVSRVLAEECYHTIIGKEDADRLIVDTHNAIQWLYELIDIDKLIELEVS